MKISIECNNCQCLFLREEKEVNRCVRKKSLVFCSSKCCGEGKRRRGGPGNYRNFQGKVWVSKEDKYSPFRKLLRKIKSRRFSYSVTVDELYALWQKQNGRCAYTGIPISMSEKKNHLAASLDRIDSKEGYHLNNIQYVSLMVNYAKSDFSEETLMRFITAIKNNE